jgi:hypothetical protein
VGFDAATVVKPLDWDFTKFGAGKGTVPEPDDKQIDQLFKDLAKVSSELVERSGLSAEVAPEQVLSALSDMPEGIGISKMVSGFTKAFAKLCQGQPTVLQLNKLPLRVRLAFYAWLMSELRPEVGGGVSMSQLNGMPRIGLPGSSALS